MDWTWARERTDWTWATTTDYIDGGAWDSRRNTIENFIDHAGEEDAAADERWQLGFACAIIRARHRDLAAHKFGKSLLANCWRLIFSSFAKF
jgi:hypothetical protein